MISMDNKILIKKLSSSSCNTLKNESNDFLHTLYTHLCMSITYLDYFLGNRVEFKPDLSHSSSFFRYLFILFFPATISVIMSGNSLGWPSPALPRLLGPDSPVPMDKDDSSWMISLMYLGNLFSPIPCGILMERIGRKMTLLYLNLFPFSSWLIILLTRSTYWLYLARFLFTLIFFFFLIKLHHLNY